MCMNLQEINGFNLGHETNGYSFTFVCACVIVIIIMYIFRLAGWIPCL